MTGRAQTEKRLDLIKRAYQPTFENQKSGHFHHSVPPSPPPPPSSADQTFWLHPVKRGRSKQIDCALRIGSIEGDFLSICRKRTWKNTRNRNVPILGSFESEKSGQSAGMRVEGGWKACICLCVCICVWVPFIMGSTHHRTVC